MALFEKNLPKSGPPLRFQTNYSEERCAKKNSHMVYSVGVRIEVKRNSQFRRRVIRELNPRNVFLRDFSAQIAQIALKPLKP